MTAMNESAYHGFFDDAAVFPPGNATVYKAVTAHLLRLDDEVTEPFVGPLVLPVDKLSEATEVAANRALTVSLTGPVAKLAAIADLAAEWSQTHPNVQIVAAEVKASEDVEQSIAQAAEFAAAHSGIRLAVELPADAVTDERLTTLGEAGVLLKFRMGGIEAHLYPSDDEVLHVLGAVARTRTPFKLTAGLHRAMRYVDPATDFYHFGFLNVAAALLALIDGDESRARALLNTDTPAEVTEAIRANPAWRELFTSFGTCNVPEPMVTLAGIAEVDEATVAHF